MKKIHTLRGEKWTVAREGNGKKRELVLDFVFKITACLLAGGIHWGGPWDDR